MILPVDTEKDEMIQKSKIENAIPEERKRKKELSKTDSEETDFKDKPKKKKKKNGEKEDKKVKNKISKTPTQNLKFREILVPPDIILNGLKCSLHLLQGQRARNSLSGVMF